MNISSVISSTFNSSDYLYSNSTEAKLDFEMSSIVYIIGVLISLPTHSYVIWLIVTGTGNGLASEFFLLNLSVCEMFLCTQTFLLPLSSTLQISILALGFLDGVYITGHSLFQCLICVERYLAVVHPVIFLKYKPLRYRLMCSAVAWIPAFVSGGVAVIMWLFCFDMYNFVWFLMFFTFLCIQLFCCVAVLRVLKQSGPGERGREREEENHMKKRAFYVILISNVTIVFIYVTLFILMSVHADQNGLKIKMCVGQLCFISAGLVQPVFFLYRVGKLNFVSKYTFILQS